MVIEGGGRKKAWHPDTLYIGEEKEEEWEGEGGREEVGEEGEEEKWAEGRGEEREKGKTKSDEEGERSWERVKEMVIL